MRSPGGDQTVVRFTLREGDDLPPICMQCGAPTTRTVKIRYHRAEASEDDNAVSALLALISLVLGVLSYMVRSGACT